MVVFRCWDFKCLLKEQKKQSTIETKIKSHMLNVDYNHFWQHRLGQRDVELIKNRAEWVFHFLFRGLRLVSTCLDIFPHGKGKYRISWCWITAGEEVHMWCFSFFFFSPPSSSINAVSLVSVVVLRVSHSWPQRRPWRHSQVYKFTYSLWDTLIRTQISSQLWKR